VIDVVTVIIAKGDHVNITAQETATSKKPKATKKARVGAQGAHVAPKKGKDAKKASPAKKTPKAAKEAGSARDGSKAGKVLDLLKTTEGATLAELMKVTGCSGQRGLAYRSTTAR
jgi:hypothetical protein